VCLQHVHAWRRGHPAGIRRSLRTGKYRAIGGNVLSCKGRGIVQKGIVAETSKLMQCECALYEGNCGKKQGLHTLDESIGRAHRECQGVSAHTVSLHGHHRRGARDDSARACMSSGFHATRRIASAKSTHSRRLSLHSSQSASRLATSSS